MLERTPEDDVLDACANALPPPNEFLLKQYRQNQVAGCIKFMEMAYVEATRLFGGQVKFRRSRILSPEERLEVAITKPRQAPTVDIAVSELMPVEFEFDYNGNPFKILLYLPYLKDNAIIINGSKYYIQFALTDRVFYHIEKDNGLGIKVLRAHLRFCRSIRHQFLSCTGKRFSDQIIQVHAHMHKHNYTPEDIRPALLLYPLAQYGLDATLERYGIDRGAVDFVDAWNKEDIEHEYFMIRKREGNSPGLYMKVHGSLLETTVENQSRLSSRVIASLHYVMQYFVRCPNTMYTDNADLIPRLKSADDFVVWKVILGRAIYGISYGNESLACGYTEQHQESLKTYIDPHTRHKLAEEGIKCDDVMDLMDYVFMNMDTYVVNHTPSNLFHKRANVLDLIFGNVVRKLFTKIYSYTNSNKKSRRTRVQDIEALFKIPPRSFTQMGSNGAVVAINPARYHDNWLITVGGRKMRATHSASNTGGGKKSKNTNHMTSPEHKYHPSWLYVESYGEVSHTHPDTAGTINMFLPIQENGTIIVEDYGHYIQEIMAEYLVTK